MITDGDSIFVSLFFGRLKDNGASVAPRFPLVSRSSAEFILITCVAVTLDLPGAEMCSCPIAIFRDSRPSSHLIPVYVSALMCWCRICTSVTRDYLHRVVKLCEGGLLKYILITGEKEKPC